MIEKLKIKLREKLCQDLIAENLDLKQKLKESQEIVERCQKKGLKEQVKKTLRYQLDEKNVYLIDFENITLIPEFVLKDSKSVCYIFVGPTVIKRAEYLCNELVFSGKHVILPIERSGRNQLDTCLSFVLGQIIAIYEPAQITLISNDTDYVNLKTLMSKGSTPYVQMEYRDIRILEQKAIDDNFLIQYMRQYMMVFTETELSKKMFTDRLKTSKPVPMQIPEVQSMFHRLLDLKLIEEKFVNGKPRIKIMKENIKDAELKDSVRNCS